MSRKIVIFQKMLFRIFFSQSSTKLYELKNSVNKIELFMQPLCILIILFSGFNLISGNIMTVMCAQWLLIFYYQLIFKGSFIFQLPLKRSFAVKNLFIFTVANIFLISVLFLCVFITIAIVPSWISEFIHGGGLPTLTTYDIAMIQAAIIVIAYFIAYTNVLTTFYFIDRIKIRIALTVILTIVLSGVNFYTYKILSKQSNDKYISLDRTLAQMQNSWSYVLVAVLSVIIVSGCGIFIAIRLSKKNQQ